MAEEYPVTNYQKYIKPRFHSDPEFRAKMYESCRKYYPKYMEKHKDDEPFKEKQRQNSRKSYHNNEEYRERKKQQALARYHRLKNDANSSVSEQPNPTVRRGRPRTVVLSIC